MSSPTLTGQVIGQAHHATRAVLERELGPLGISFHQSVALNAVAADGGVIGRDRLVERMTGGLKLDEAAVRATLDKVTAAGLLRELPTGGSGLALTDAGRAVQHRIADTVTGITARLYADIPAEELTVAARVLALVKQRADAELTRG